MSKKILLSTDDLENMDLSDSKMSPEELRNLSKFDLHTLYDALLTQKRRLEAQLYEAEMQRKSHKSQTYANLQWVIQAKKACKVRAVQLNVIQSEIGLRNREEKKQATQRYERNFIEVAKRVLTSSVYENIVREAMLLSDMIPTRNKKD